MPYTDTLTPSLVALVLGQATVTTTVDLTLPLTDWPTAEPTAPRSVDAEPVDEPVDEPVHEPVAEPVSEPVAEPGAEAPSSSPLSAREQELSRRFRTGAAALDVRLLTALRGTDDEVVDGVHIVRTRGHLQLVVDRPTSPGTDLDPPHPSPPSPSDSLPSERSSVLPWLVGVEHPRVGVLLPDAILRLLADPDTRLRLHGAHPDTGALTTHDPTSYRPRTALARAVRARDGHCRFPGCTTTAARCQLDHVTPYPTGPTTAANLAALCPGHHRLKTHTPWRYVLHPDGTCTWTSPLGHTYDTHPDRPTDRAA